MKSPSNCPRCGVQLPASADSTAPCPRCLMQLGMEEEAPQTAPFDIPDFDEVVSTFPTLDIIEHVGSGGMGVVYHARQKGLERDVALKLVPEAAAADPAFAERFTREARALASLSHPAITSVYDFGQVGRFYYLIMEFVDGANLRQVMNAGELSSPEALTLVSRMCEALQYAHDNGIVHRDIKPENLLIDRAGNLKIIDFGLAKMLAQAPTVSPLTRTDQAMGTWHYMAPEQVERPLEVDHRADIYSMGVVFYELLTGELPLGRFSAPSTRGSSDVRLDGIVMRTLEKEPQERYQRAGQVKTDLENMGESRGTAPTPASASAKQKSKIGSKAAGLTLGTGCLIIFLIVVGCFTLGIFGYLVSPAGVEQSEAQSFSTTVTESSGSSATSSQSSATASEE